MRSVRILSLALAATLAVGFAAPAHATPIAVNNAQFSTLPAGGLNNVDSRGNYSYFVGIPGWTTAGASGQFAPTNIPFTGFNGSNVVGFSNGPTISQTVGATVQTGVVYTFTVDLGFRMDPGTAFTGTADLLINGHQYFALGAPVIGTFQTFTAVYTGLAADAGQAITIELNSSGVQGDYDNVTLNTNASATPEPSSIALLGTGLLGMGGMVRRRFVKA